MQWMAEPARWMGSLPGVASTARQTPEQLALDIGFVVAWIVAIGLALWWLLRVRIHNRWREQDRKSTRLNSSHSQISYAVFCLKKKKKNHTSTNKTHTTT